MAHKAAIRRSVLALTGALPMMLPVTAAAAGTTFNAPMSGAISHVFHSSSNNWSGYAVTGKKFTSVSASWIQPAATCSSKTTYSSFWVGLDGDGSNSVEQTGSEVDCTGGRAKYYSWYEMYPAYPVNFSNTVRAGDHFTASVTNTGGANFTLVLTDSTQGWSHTVNKTLTNPALASAEVIAEAPSSSSGVLPLTNYGTINFTAADANGASMAGQNPDPITMASGSTTKATVSSISSSGAFSDTWHHN